MSAQLTSVQESSSSSLRRRAWRIPFARGPRSFGSVTWRFLRREWARPTAGRAWIRFLEPVAKDWLRPREGYPSVTRSTRSVSATRRCSSVRQKGSPPSELTSRRPCRCRRGSSRCERRGPMVRRWCHSRAHLRAQGLRVQGTTSGRGSWPMWPTTGQPGHGNADRQDAGSPRSAGRATTSSTAAVDA